MRPLIDFNAKAVLVRAPGKIILSGEYAALYGQPALAVAMPIYHTLSLAQTVESGYQLEWLDLEQHNSLKSTDLHHLKADIDKRFEAYQQKHLPIESVLSEPKMLNLYVLASEISRLDPLGLKLRSHSDIPMGCGLGSSAASIVALLYGLERLQARKPDKKHLWQKAQNFEHRQHGQSSGLDCYMSVHGGLVLWQALKPQSLKHTLTNFYWTNTGRALNSTGQCVAHAKKYLQDEPLLDSFGAVTQALVGALAQRDLSELIYLIKQNHRLLCRLGVIPQPVQDFIKSVEAVRGAAKIAGAGSLQGAGGGSVILVGEFEPLQHIAQKHGFELKPIIPDLKGVRFV